MTVPGVRIVSSTKDSIYVQWQPVSLSQQRDHLSSPGPRGDIRGYKVIYQAIGSSYVQQTKLLSRDVDRYDITFLHENTYYNICVRSFLNSTHFVDDPGCVRGSTHTDSLGVAIGSTFGAFLALSFIVLLVFLAKRQHNIQTKKHLGESGPDGPEMVLDDALIHMSDSIYIQLCRQKPGFLERLREINAEAVPQQQQQNETEEPPPAPDLMDAGGTTGFLEDSSERNVEGVPVDEAYEDGLLKPPAIPGVIIQPRTTPVAKGPQAIQRRPLQHQVDSPSTDGPCTSSSSMAMGHASDGDRTPSAIMESIRT